MADFISDGWKHWLKWMEVSFEQGLPSSQEEIEMLSLDGGRNLGFTRLVARKKEGYRRTASPALMPPHS